MKPRVLMFGWEFPPHISGGLGTACYGLTRGLTSHQAGVIFVVPKLIGDEETGQFQLISASDISLDTVKLHSQEIWRDLTLVGVHSYLRPYLSPERFEELQKMHYPEGVQTSRDIYSEKYEFSHSYGMNLMEEVSRFALVGGLLATRHEFDIIHAHDWLTYPAGVAAKTVSGKPLIVHVHATEFDRSGEHINQQVYDIERAGMHAADRVIAVSNLTRGLVIERYGVDPDKVVTVHNAVMSGPTDPASQSKFSREKLVTFLGRVTFQKGPEYFVEAAHRVLLHDNNVRFAMAGSGDMLHGIVKRVAQLRMASKFNFTGFLKGEEVDHIFAMSDVYVMPSVSEPFGISPLEAMRSNVPVIISKQSGVAEILEHAFKVDFWDIDGIADAIYALLHYPALSRMFVRYGKEEVENLKWDNAAFKVLHIYYSLINRGS